MKFKEVSSNPNFPEMEKELLKEWFETGVVEKYLHKNDQSNKKFSFIDGPITANNPMGVHHAWGRTYKDLWQRFHNLLGEKQRFQNGFDCQGLWVEVEVEKELGLKSKKDIENLVPGDKKASIAKFVDLCKERVLKYSSIQTEQSKRLGYFMDWGNSYYTMSEENNYTIWHFLKVCREFGWIYKGRESVPWCPRCETAISQHEISTEEYKEVTHETVYFKLPIIGREREYLLIWTTTPWTIPANNAVAVDPNLEYTLVEDQTGDKFWLAREAVEKVFKGGYKLIIKTVSGSELVGFKYLAPFRNLEAVKKTSAENSDRTYLVVATDPQILPISALEGTGLVHLAGSAGTEDFQLGKKLGLSMIPVIADNADYLPGLGFLTGQNAKKHPELILDYLKQSDPETGNNWVFDIVKYTHRYPVCWRCKTELVWKVADEWYIAMDKPAAGSKDGRTLRERMTTVAGKIKWLPSFGLDRELDWLKNMHDWLISKKNRYWGLALPIFECQSCGQFEIIGSREELKQRATSGWSEFEGHTPHKPWIDDVVIKCACGGESHRIPDVGNPWLDAGIVPYSTLVDPKTTQVSYLTDKSYWQEWFPADFITESFPGQFKNWFYSLIATSAVLKDTNPFKTVLGFALLFGENGQIMHKSLGNMVEFNEGADKIGVDVMRWLFCRQNPSDDLVFSYKKADEVRRQFYLMLWNSYKYFVDYANLESDLVPETLPESSNVLDRWFLSRLAEVTSLVEKYLLAYDAQSAVLNIEMFVSDLSTWYIRRSRDRVWVNSEDEVDKKAFYGTLKYVFVEISKVLSPFLPFVSDDIYVNLTGGASVHLSDWPQPSLRADENLISDMSLVREISETGHRNRKDRGLKVRQVLQKVTISLPGTKVFVIKDNLNQYEELIKAELNVKEVIWLDDKTLEIEVAYDTTLSDGLVKEGKARELVRQIQDERKRLGLKPSDKVNLILPEGYPIEFEVFISRKALASKIAVGSELQVIPS